MAITKERLARLREAIQHAKDELDDVNKLVDSKGCDVDLGTLEDFSEGAFAAVESLHNTIKRMP